MLCSRYTLHDKAAHLFSCSCPAADGSVELTLTKAEGMHWWKSVLADGPVIDVQAVEPESSKLTDLDPETRQTVEKMMVGGRSTGYRGQQG